MCDFYSCIVTRDGKVLEGYNSNSHEKIIRINNLDDSKLEDRDFVRMEITPNDKDLQFSRDRSNWNFRLDEAKSIPTWFEEDSTRYINLAWNAWQKFMDELPLIDDVASVIPELSELPDDWDEVKTAVADYNDISKAGLFGYIFDYSWKVNKVGKNKIPAMYIGSKVFDRDKLKELAERRNILV